ncbi:hypothetical protein GCM10009718_22790 [Isoptericola halotolerans]
MRTAPEVGSYRRTTSWEMVVFPAPDGPTRATIDPAGTENVTSRRVVDDGSSRTVATDSSEASETSSARG